MSVRKLAISTVIFHGFSAVPSLKPRNIIAFFRILSVYLSYITLSFEATPHQTRKSLFNFGDVVDLFSYISIRDQKQNIGCVSTL
jgi:hypothetical protein